MTTLEKTLIVFMLAVVAFLGQMYWNGSGDAPAQAPAAGDAASRSGMASQKSGGNESYATIESSSPASGRSATTSEPALRRTRIKAPTARAGKPKGIRRNRSLGSTAERRAFRRGERGGADRGRDAFRNDTNSAPNDATNSDTGRDERKQTRQESDPSGAATLAQLGGTFRSNPAPAPEQDLADPEGSGEAEKVLIEPDKIIRTGPHQGVGGNGEESSYYCELARSIREDCEGMGRDEAGYERCLSFGGYYTRSRHCGYRP